MVITGIPHGATDHLIYSFIQRQNGEQVSYREFVITYLVAMLLYGVCWYFFPLWSLVVFLVLSAYHFGQSQLLYISLEEQHPFKLLLYVMWGATILISILLFHWPASQDILINFIPQSFLIQIDQFTYRAELPWVLMGIVLLGLSIAWGMGNMSIKQYVYELMNLILLMLLFYHTTLLISFAVYFGLWHSIASILTEVKALQSKGIDISLKGFVREALPLSLISFLGIGILLVVAQWGGAVISPYLLFFIAISTLTLPHMYFMNKFYKISLG